MPNREPVTPGSKIFEGLSRRELDVLMAKIDAGNYSAQIVNGYDEFSSEMFDTKHDMHVAWMNQD